MPWNILRVLAPLLADFSTLRAGDCCSCFLSRPTRASRVCPCRLNFLASLLSRFLAPCSLRRSISYRFISPHVVLDFSLENRWAPKIVTHVVVGMVLFLFTPSWKRWSLICCIFFFISYFLLCLPISRLFTFTLLLFSPWFGAAISILIWGEEISCFHRFVMLLYYTIFPMEVAFVLLFF